MRRVKCFFFFQQAVNRRFNILPCFLDNELNKAAVSGVQDEKIQMGWGKKIGAHHAGPTSHVYGTTQQMLNNTFSSYIHVQTARETGRAARLPRRRDYPARSGLTCTGSHGADT